MSQYYRIYSRIKIEFILVISSQIRRTHKPMNKSTQLVVRDLQEVRDGFRRHRRLSVLHSGLSETSGPLSV